MLLSRPENYDNTNYHAGHKTVECSKLQIGDEDVRLVFVTPGTNNEDAVSYILPIHGACSS